MLCLHPYFVSFWFVFSFVMEVILMPHFFTGSILPIRIILCVYIGNGILPTYLTRNSEVSEMCFTFSSILVIM